MRYYGLMNGVLSQTMENPPPLPGGVFFTSLSDLANVTGKCFFDAPAGAFAPVEASDYPAFPNHIFPQDGADIPKFVYEEVWLSSYKPQGYVGVEYNTLFNASDMAKLSKTQQVTIPFGTMLGGGTHTVGPRMQIGRAVGVAGVAANSVCLMEANYGWDDTAALPGIPPIPGAIITEVIDISALRPAGASQFIVDWRIGQYILIDEVIDYGNANNPSLKYFQDDEFPDGSIFFDWVFKVGLFTEAGVFLGWVTRMEPYSCGCGAGPTTLTRFRLGFFNFWPSAIYLLGYAVLY